MSRSISSDSHSSNILDSINVLLSLYWLYPLYLWQDFRITHHPDLSPMDTPQVVTPFKWQRHWTLCHSIYCLFEIFAAPLYWPLSMSPQEDYNASATAISLGKWKMRSVRPPSRPLQELSFGLTIFLSSLLWF